MREYVGMSRERKERDQQSGCYYELDKHSECAEKGAQEGLGTASWEGVGDAEVLQSTALPLVRKL